MKMKINIIAVLLSVMPLILASQDWGGLKPYGFWNHWSVNANIGLTSYFGDLSYYDKDVKGKLTYESGPAVGLMLTKHFSKSFGIAGEIVYGSLEGGNNRDISFETELLEYNMQARLDFIQLMFPNRSPKFGIEGHAGFGQFIFKSTKYELKGEIEDSYVHETRVPEFVYFYGLGMHYHISDRIAITGELSLHHAQNDKLDNLVKNNDFDYYSYLSLGFTYYIDSFKKSPLKNKARLAHNGVRAN